MNTPDDSDARRTTLLQMRDLLDKGPLNWTDDEIRRLAGFTSIPEADLAVMRHKMRRASEFSIGNLQALDALIDRSDNPTQLRELVERPGSVHDALQKATTFTGHFHRVKEQLDLVDAELKTLRRRRHLPVRHATPSPS